MRLVACVLVGLSNLYRNRVVWQLRVGNFRGVYRDELEIHDLDKRTYKYASVSTAKHRSGSTGTHKMVIALLVLAL